MSKNVFDDLPEDQNDLLIKEFDAVSVDKLSKRKRHVWQLALKWALEQEVAYLTCNGYAELIFEDKMMRLKFKQKLYDKFKHK